MVCAMKLKSEEFAGKCIHVPHRCILLQLIISTLDTHIIFTAVKLV